MTARKAFVELLAPFTLDEFLDQHWGKFSLASSSKHDWLPSLFSWEKLRRAVRDLDLPCKLATRDSQGHQQERNAEGAFVNDQLTPGTTICIQDLHRNDPELSALLCDAREMFGMAGGHVVSCYASADAGGFGLHYDDQHVFILQVDGTKRWRFGRAPAVAYPPNNLLVQHRAEQQRVRPDLVVPEPRAEDVLETRLVPGQVLYLPPGTWHAAQAEELSLGLTLSFAPTRFLPTIGDCVRRTLERDPLYREGAPPVAMGKGLTEPAENLRQHFELQKRLLKAAVDGLTLEQYWDCWCQGVGRRFPVDQATKLAPLLVDGDSDVVLQRGPRRLKLPREVRPLLAWVLQSAMGCGSQGGPATSGEQASTEFDQEDVTRLLHILEKAGLWEGPLDDRALRR